MLNLKGEYVFTPKEDDNAARMRALAVEQDSATQLMMMDPEEVCAKAVLQQYPLDLPIEDVLDHPLRSLD